MKLQHFARLLAAAGLAWVAVEPVFATVTFVGRDLDTDAGWRTPTAAKPNDIDQDNLYGSAGYYLASGLRGGYKDPFLTDNLITGASNPDDLNTLPAYLVSIEYADAAERGRSWGGDGGNFGRLDAVGGSTGLTGAAILRRSDTVLPLELVIKRTDSPAFRLTLIFGNNPNEGGFNNPEGQTVTVDDGSGPVTEITGDAVALADRTAGYTTYQSWDISAGNSDIRLVLEGIPAGEGIARLSGLAIDVAGVRPPEIVVQPQGGEFLAGVNVRLTVTAVGANPSFQWYKGETAISGATGAEYALPNLQPSAAGSYRVVVSNAAGSVTSEPAVVAVANSLPTRLVTYQNAVKQTASLISLYPFDNLDTADSVGSNDGTPAGAVQFVEGVGGGAAKAMQSGGLGHVNLGDPLDLNFADLSGTVELWLRADWATSPGYNPCIFADRDGGSVNYSLHLQAGKRELDFWNGSAVSAMAIPDAGTEWHHLAVVFDNSTWTTYWDGAVVGTQDLPLGFSPEAPTQLGSSSPAGGERWVGALDEVAFYEDPLTAAQVQGHYLAWLAGEPPILRTQPVGGVFVAGTPLTLRVVAVGNALSYQWYKNGEAVGGATSDTLSFASLATANAGAYHVVVSNPAGNVPSEVATVEVADSLPAPLVAFQAAVRQQSSLLAYYTFEGLNAEDTEGTYDGTVAGTGSFVTGIGGGAAKAFLGSAGAHVNLGQVDVLDFVDGTGTVQLWLRADWTASPGYNPCVFADRDSALVNYSIHLDAARTQIAFWNGSAVSWVPLPGVATGWHYLVVVFENSAWTIYWDGQTLGTYDHPFGFGPEAPTQLGSSTPGGAERWIGPLDEVAFLDDALTAEQVQTLYAAYAAGEPPVITSQPRGGLFFQASALDLTVAVRGVNLTYQWFKDGKAVTGATAGTLSLPSLTPADAASYHVVVSNAAGSATSDAAVVRVIVPDLPAYQAAVSAESSLISYYRFDASDANDSKSANHGVLDGDAAFGPGVGGGADRALLLTGLGSAGFGPIDAFDFADGTGSFEVWLRADWTDTAGYNPCIVADRDGGPVNYSLHLRRSNKSVIDHWNGSAVSSIGIPDAGTIWHHFAVTFNGSTWTVYWDGELAGTAQQPFGAAPEAPTQIGSSAPFTSEGWMGALDEAAFYSETLDEAAIRRHYEALAGPITPVEPVLGITRSGNQLTITWPPSLTGYVLEVSDRLPASAWGTVSGVVNNSVTVTTSLAAQYYRLRKP